MDKSCLHLLREPFVGTLCMADAGNILDSIAAIARNIHRKQSPSGPHVSTPESSELQSEAVACGSLTPAPLEELMADVALDQSSDSNSGGSEEESSSTCDTGSSDSQRSSNGQLMGSSSHSEPSELNATDREFEAVADIDGCTLQGKQSVLSHVTGKLRRRKKQRADHCQRTRHRGGQTAGSKSQSHFFKRKHKQLSLYGMWAGSFPIREMYMNS